MAESSIKNGTGALKLRVLLVEDSEADALVLIKELAHAGYDPVFERVQTSEAMKSALGKSWDVIISDYKMPRFNGLDALMLRNGLAPDLPFILVSGFISVEIAIEVLKAGAQDYLSKNDLDRLGLVVQRSLKEAESQREHRRLQEQMSQAQKMEAVGQLAGGVAHDFNNILQVILGYAEVAMTKEASREYPKVEISEIHKSALRAAELTRQLLSFSRRQMIMPSVLNLNDTIADMRVLLERLMGEDVQVTVRLDPNAGCIYADAGQIEQVIMNLVMNGHEAMPNGGRLEVETSSVVLGEEDARQMVDARPGHYVTMRITDSGVGMDSHLLNHIFEPFFSTKGIGKGTGLGLSVTYGIIRQHNGWIHVRSEVGNGSSFVVYMPVYQGKNAVQTAGQPEATPPMGSGEHILLVEDEEEVRELAMRVLISAGYLVTVAATVREGLEALTRTREPFDLVFSDVVLPDGNGVDLVEKALERRPSVAILLSSGYADDRACWGAIEKRGFMFLAKPHTPSMLLRAIRGALTARAEP